MPQLDSTIVRRGGKTARKWYETIRTVNLNSSNEELRIDFTIDSKGTGQTKLQMVVGPADFLKVIESMCAANRPAALEAMSIAMTKQLATKKGIYSAFEWKAERRILRAAQSKWLSEGRDLKHRAVVDAISEIIDGPSQ